MSSTMIRNQLVRLCVLSALTAMVTACAVPVEEGDPADTETEAATSCSIPSFVAATPSPVGWASENGGTTGGGSATPIVVTTLAQFNAAAKGTTKAVIHVSGSLGQGTATIGSNKTIIGCSGEPTLNGHVELKTSTNVIIRNLNIVGYNCAPPDINTKSGGQCQNGQDAVTVEKESKNIWFDHDAISDGSDGNLDIVHGSDFITVSYTKFFYSDKRTDPNDTGAAGHRFSSLVGGSDSNGSEDSGHLNVTWHHNWWGNYVVERSPRIRFGKNHLFNNLYTNAGDDYCIGLGVSANVRVEENAFEGVKVPFNVSSYSNSSSVLQSVGNLFSGTSGNTSGKGTAFTPPYHYTAEAASAVQADVEANAGPH